MDIADLEVFTDVAKLGSLVAAARQRDLDPSKVSRIISGLEQSLGLRLFQRSTRSVVLTEAGSLYLQSIEPLLEELRAAEDAARAMSSIPKGSLRMTASVAFGQVCLLPRLQPFRQQYPDINLDIKLTDENIDLLTSSTDLACRLAPNFDADLVGIKLFETRYFVCASQGYVDTHSALRHPGDLESHNCLVFDLPGYRTRWLFEDENGEYSAVQVKSNFSLSSALALRECAILGMGPALLADWLVKDKLASGSLVKLFPDYRVTATDYTTAAWLLYPSRKYVPLKTRLMIDYLRSYHW